MGSPVTRLLINGDGILADNRLVGSFGTGDYRPATMIVRLLPAERKLVLAQLNRAGQQFAQDGAVGYVEVLGAYAVYGPGGLSAIRKKSPKTTLRLASRSIGSSTRLLPRLPCWFLGAKRTSSMVSFIAARATSRLLDDFSVSADAVPDTEEPRRNSLLASVLRRGEVAPQYRR